MGCKCLYNYTQDIVMEGKSKSDVFQYSEKERIIKNNTKKLT